MRRTVAPVGPRKSPNDTEAICEAVTRPSSSWSAPADRTIRWIVRKRRTRFVPVKSAERQAALLDHKARDFLVRQRTQTVNAIRVHLSEFGIVVARGIHTINGASMGDHARRLTAAWREDYNHHRPHTSLDGLTPPGNTSTGQRKTKPGTD